MTDSILEASKKARKSGLFGFFRRKWVIATIILVLAASGYQYYRTQGKKAEEASATPQAKEARASRGDIKIAIEADGKVVAKDGVDLSFSVSGDTLEVTDVYVKEGQKIKKGDKLAKVKADSLEMSVQTAYANYQSVLASYNEKLDGMTESEATKAQNSIKQAELALTQANDSLARTKTNGQKNIENAQDKIDTAKDNLDNDFRSDYQEAIDKAYSDLLSNLKSTQISLNTILKNSDEIIGVDDTMINDSFESSLGAKDVDSLSRAISSYNDSKAAFESLESKLSGLSAADTSGVESASELQATLLDTVEDHLYDMQNLLASSISSANLSQNTLDSFKSSVSGDRASVNSRISSLDSARKTLSDAKRALSDYSDDYADNQKDLRKAYDDAVKDLATVKEDLANDIKDAERNIETKKLALTEAKQNYEDLKQPLTAAELASAKSQLTSAAVNLEKAKDELENATLVSPIDGQISQLNYKAGDTILKDNTDPFVSIINNDTLFVEVNIEEADISKLKTGQKAVAAFDALDGLEIDGEISFISLSSQTSSNGIVTYLVRILFENAKDAEVREGMTAGVEFVISGVENVIKIPVQAVRNVEGKPSVELKDGTRATVTTGFTDGENVEIIAGLKEGTAVVY